MRDIFIGLERTCADKDCNKTFIMTCPADYVYKIRGKRNTMKYYCCYTHWIKAKRKIEAEAQQRRDAYYERYIEKKRKENKLRRERKNGHTQDV